MSQDSVVRGCLIVLTTITSLAVLRFMQPALAPMLVAVPIACLIWPIHRSLAARIGGGGSVSVIGAVLLLTVIGLAALGYGRREQISDYVRGAIVEVGRSMQSTVRTVMTWAEDNDLEVDAVLPEALSEVAKDAEQSEQPSHRWSDHDEFRSVASVARKLQERTSIGLSSIMGQLLTGGLALVLMAYLLIEATRRGTNSLSRIEPDYRYKLEDELAHITDEVRSYFKACLGVGLVTGTMTTLLAWFVGMPYPMAWGLMLLIGEFIPTLGAVVSLGTIALVGFTTLDTSNLLILLVGLAVIQGIEAAILQPVLLGRALRMSPLLTLLSLIFWGWLLGILGAFMAVPLTTITFRSARFLYRNGTPRYIEKKSAPTKSEP